jgi:4,5-dihydroxyphthalate decarboxylase
MEAEARPHRVQEHLREALDALGEGYWDYGIEKNRHVLETFARYSHEQGSARKRRPPEELFVVGADQGFRV